MEDLKAAADDGYQKRPGYKIIRIKRHSPRKKLRVTPNIPGVIRFFGDMVRGTPFIPLMLALLVLLLLSAMGIYLVEQATNPQFSLYLHTVWWAFSAVQTQGANSPGPITPLGILIGTIWSIVGTIGFFGVILGAIYTYCMVPEGHRRLSLMPCSIILRSSSDCQLMNSTLSGKP